MKRFNRVNNVINSSLSQRWNSTLSFLLIHFYFSLERSFWLTKSFTIQLGRKTSKMCMFLSVIVIIIVMKSIFTRKTLNFSLLYVGNNFIRHSLFSATFRENVHCKCHPTALLCGQRERTKNVVFSILMIRAADLCILYIGKRDNTKNP